MSHELTFGELVSGIVGSVAFRELGQQQIKDLVSSFVILGLDVRERPTFEQCVAVRCVGEQFRDTLINGICVSRADGFGRRLREAVDRDAG